MVTEKEFIEHFKMLRDTGAIYVWGANCEIITQSLCDKLFKNYGSATYTKTYYNGKFKEGVGKYGADCSGSYCPVSGYDNTAKGYYNDCIKKGNIACMPMDRPCLLFNANFTHTGAYIGDGTTVEMRSSQMNVFAQPIDKTRWTYYGIPKWIEYDGSTKLVTPKVMTSVVDAIEKHLSSEYGIKIKLTGTWSAEVKKALTKAFQMYLNKAFNKTLTCDGIMGPKTKAACTTWSERKPGLTKDEGTYLIQAILCLRGFGMTNSIENGDLDGQYGVGTRETIYKVQEQNRGLRQDGIAGPATIYALLK